jgi:hypothetical protein
LCHHPKSALFSICRQLKELIHSLAEISLLEIELSKGNNSGLGPWLKCKSTCLEVQALSSTPSTKQNKNKNPEEIIMDRYKNAANRKLTTALFIIENSEQQFTCK